MPGREERKRVSTRPWPCTCCSPVARPAAASVARPPRPSAPSPGFPREEDQLLARFRLTPADASGKSDHPRPTAGATAMPRKHKPPDAGRHECFRVKAIVGSFEPRRPSRRRGGSKSTVVLAAFQQALWRDEEHGSRSPPRWPPSAHPRSCCALATSKRSPAACSAPHHQGPCGASHGAQTGGSSASNNTTPRAPTHTPRHRGPSTARPPTPTAAERSSSDHITRPQLLCGVAGSPHAEIDGEREETKASRVEPRNVGALAYPTLRQNRGRTHDIRHQARPGPSARSAPINAVDHVVYIIGSRFDRQYPASPGHRRADAHGPE